MSSLNILIFNSILYIATLIIYFSKKKCFDHGLICLLAFSISSLGSVWYYSFENVPIYYPNIRVEALLYIYILFILCITPLLQLKRGSIKHINITGYEDILFYLSILFSFLSIPVFVNLILNFGLISFSGNALNSMYESDIDTASIIFAPWSKVFFSAIRRFYDLILFLFFYNLAYKKNKKLIIMLGISILSFFMYSFQGGSRGGLVMNLLSAIAYLLIFYNTFTNTIKKSIRFFGISIICILAISLSLISVSRFTSNGSDKSDMIISQWISQYIGEGMIRFSDTLYPIENKLDGDKNFGFLKSLIGYDHFDNNEKANLHYQSKLGIETSVFYTFIGSFYLDFNTIGTIILCLLLYLVLNRIKNSIQRYSSIGFLETFVLAKLFLIYSSGFTSNVYAVTSIQKDEFVFWIVIIIIYLVHNLQLHNKTRAYK